MAGSDPFPENYLQGIMGSVETVLSYALAIVYTHLVPGYLKIYIHMQQPYTEAIVCIHFAPGYI